MSKNLEAAIQYRNDGFNVIPVNRQKRPLVPWTDFQKEFPQIDLIYEWWSKWPDAGIGIITGEISGCCVVDVDVKDGKPGMEEIAKLLPEGYTVHAKTPSGGCHLYFKNRNGTGNRVEFRPGLDFRGEGGYVVAPESPGYKPVAPLRREGLVEIPDAVFLALHENLGTNNAIKIDSIPYSFNNIVTRINCEDRANVSENRQNATATCELPENAPLSCQHSANTLPTSDEIRQQCQQLANIFIKGRRDNDLFHLANQLAKAGSPPEEIFQFVYFCGKHCSPPFSDRDIVRKVESALKRVSGRDRNMTNEILDYVSSTCGTFTMQEVCSHLQAVDRKERNAVSVVLGRLVKEESIERVGSRNGMFRKVEQNAPVIDIFAESPKFLDIQYPLGLHSLFKTMQKNLIVVAGTQDAGKTAFLLRFVAMNMNRELPIRYMSSEMGQQELRSRLELFNDIPLSDWKSVDFREISTGFQDYILPDGINIIDYLEVTDNFWLIGEDMRKIYAKLKTGIVVLAIQKDHKSELGRGGSFSNEKPRLYLTLSADPPNGGIAKIKKCKNWRDPSINPNGRECRFKVRSGSEIRQITQWQHVERSGV